MVWVRVIYGVGEYFVGLELAYRFHLRYVEFKADEKLKTIVNIITALIKEKNSFDATILDRSCLYKVY